MATINILVVEDERSLSDVLVEILRQNEYAVDAAYDGQTGLEQALTGIYDLIILDIMLPRMNGLDMLRAMRAEHIATPVLLLTAKSEVSDKIRGLDTGADDYLTKPFATGELLARVRAMTRRQGAYLGDALQIGNTQLDLRTHEVRSGAGAGVRLGLKEYQIMELLMRNARQVIPRERFIERVWGYETDTEYNAIEVYVSFLRKKLAAIGADIQIRAVRGVGYALEEAS